MSSPRSRTSIADAVDSANRPSLQDDCDIALKYKVTNAVADPAKSYTNDFVGKH
jgi:hypothetical protein